MSAEENDRAAWFKGPWAKCSVLPPFKERPWRLVLLGAPGVGKGTQAELISRRLHGCHLSTGDLFRAANNGCRAGTPAVAEALRYMRQGELVPDSIVWELARERTGCIRCRGGFVLDGLPRTLAQAQALQELLNKECISLDAVLDYELPRDQIIFRLGGRRICEACKAVFHLTQCPPSVPDLCDQCGGRLIQREDDRPDSIATRLDAYQHLTMPLIEFYRNLNLLLPVSAIGSPEEVFARSIAALETAITDGPLRSRDPRDAIAGLSDHRENSPRNNDELL